MGAPLECEHRDLNFSDQIIQRTTTGLDVYHIPTNTFAFTNGYQWWSLNNGQFRYWTQDATTNKASDGIPAFTDAECAANPTATGPGLAVYCFSVYADSLTGTLQQLQATAPVSLPQSSDTATPLGGVVQSRIDGDFNGWDGETIFVLQNGQIWQQAAYDYVYEYAYSPSVIVYPVSGGYRLRVDGLDKTIPVQRLK